MSELFNNKNIVFYTNCQGRIGVSFFLSKKINFKSIIYIETHKAIWLKKDLHKRSTCFGGKSAVSSLNNADIFIYQPINRKHGKYSTYIDVDNNILTHLKPDCIKISFPYIYFACLFPLYPSNSAAEIDGGNEYDVSSEIFNKDVIIELRKKHSHDEIVKLYNKNKIDFKFKKNYDETIKRTKQNEKVCNIKISHLFTMDNIKKIKLMHTYNHPTNFVLKYIANEVLKILNVPQITSEQNYDELLPKGCHYSIYSYNYYKFDWLNPDDCDEDFFKKYLLEILKKQ